MTEPSWINGPPRRIILATDLSARCDRALDRAAALASAWQAELIACMRSSRSRISMPRGRNGVCPPGADRPTPRASPRTSCDTT